MDKLDPDRRSENMRRIPSKNTIPELTVRRIVRALGHCGYRIHKKDIPGKPDIAWIGRKRAIFVHGCFWHGHNCKEGLRKPKSKIDYWLPKIESNKKRDAEHNKTLKADGWKILTIWECELKNVERVEKRLKKLLDT
jgi:DNA mismatch endonuclease, patch repair protein